MTSTELLSLLQFGQRWTVRTLPSGLSTQGELQLLLGLYAGIEVGEEASEPNDKPAACVLGRSGPGAVVMSRSGPVAVVIARSGPGAVRIREI